MWAVVMAVPLAGTMAVGWAWLKVVTMVDRKADHWVESTAEKWAERKGDLQVVR